jgi:hypothetical protein
LVPHLPVSIFLSSPGPGAEKPETHLQDFYVADFSVGFLVTKPVAGILPQFVTHRLLLARHYSRRNRTT